MLDDLIQASEGLRKQLLDTIAASEKGVGFELTALNQHPSGCSVAERGAPVDLVVLANEINNRHGTGVLLQRIFPDSRGMVAIRSRTHYRGEQNFGDASFCLPRPEMPRHKIFHVMLGWLGKMEVRRVLCVPYYPEDALVAIAAKEMFAALLCTYVMDDQNITCQGIPDVLMRELLGKSQLRLAISPEMRQAYQTKYGKEFWFVPPLVAPELISSDPVLRGQNAEFRRTGVLAGNVWGQRWLDLLRRTVRGSGIRIEWYCNGGSSPVWLSFDPKELEADGIFIHPPLPEPEMSAVLRQHAFALLPSGTLDEKDDNSAVATLSLPTRVPFTLASSGTPILVMGNPGTAAAKFIKRFDVGDVCDYNGPSFTSAVARLSAPETQARCRQNAAKIAAKFSAHGATRWIWDSLRDGKPVDQRFEELMPVAAEATGQMGALSRLRTAEVR